MTDQLPERIWAYQYSNGEKEWFTTMANATTPYIRADTAIPRAEVDAMVAAVVEKAAGVCSRLYKGERHQDDYDQGRDDGLDIAEQQIRALTPADARAAFEQAVREAREAGYAEGYDEGYSLVGLTTQQAIEKAKLAWALAYLSDESQHIEEIDKAVREAVDAERERCADINEKAAAKVENGHPAQALIYALAAEMRAPQETSE